MSQLKLNLKLGNTGGNVETKRPWGGITTKELKERHAYIRDAQLRGISYRTAVQEYIALTMIQETADI